MSKRSVTLFLTILVLLSLSPLASAAGDMTAVPNADLDLVPVLWGEGLARPLRLPGGIGLASITLAEFTAENAPTGVNLKWTTGSEINTLGFNIYRQPHGGTKVKINDALIPAKGVGFAGASYSYLDTNVSANVTYDYYLEDQDTYGVTHEHGPVTITWVPMHLYQSRLRLGSGPNALVISGEFRWEEEGDWVVSIVAPDPLVLGGVTYRLEGWFLNGVSVPGNPIQFQIYAPSTAVAVYYVP